MKRKLTQDDCLDVQTNSFLSLPDDILVEIFKKFRPEIILSSFALVCKRFFEVTQSPFLWQFKQDQHFPMRKVPAQTNETSLSIFKMFYQLTHENKKFSRLISCVIEGDVAALRAAKLALTDFFQSQTNLFELATLWKQQAVLDHAYELARAGFVSDDGLTVDVNKVDGYGNTLLMWAVETNQINEIILQLIKNGANVNHFKPRSDDGATSLLLAVRRGRLAIVKLLLENEAAINQADKNNKTPLYNAADMGYLEVVKLLLKNGANVNQFMNDGWTPLCVAAQNGYLEVVKLLIKNGADTKLAGNDGNNSLCIAVGMGHLAIAEELLLAGANIDKASECFSLLNLLEIQFKNSIVEIKPSNTLQEGIILLKPDFSLSSHPNSFVNFFMILILEKTYQFLANIRKDQKEALEIRNLLNLIYSNSKKSFAVHVDEWGSQANSQERAVTNQDIISVHSKSDSENGNVRNAPIGQISLFSQSNPKLIEKKAKTEVENLINELVLHSLLWTRKLNVDENISSSSSTQLIKTSSLS